jgi:anaerobic selenocysteine-containing dehydrogenase
VTTVGQRVDRIRGDPEHPISRGYNGPKGRALASLHHDSRRLDRPSVSVSGSQRHVDWNRALDDLAGRLRDILDEDGPEAIAGYLGTAVAFDAAGYAAANAFLRGLGTSQRYTCATLDTPCKPLISGLLSGFPGLHPIPDSDSTRLLLLVGTNPVVSHGHLTGLANPVSHLRRIAHRGEIWVIDPRRTETTGLATRHLQIRAGTDAWLLAALVREILNEGADTKFIAEHVDAVDELARAVAPFDLARASEVCDVPLSALEELVAVIRRSGRLAAVSGTGSTMSSGANVNEWLLWALQIITGSFERPGGAWFNPGFVSGLDRVPHWTPGNSEAGLGPPSRPELPRRNGEFPCAGLVDEIESGRIRALFVPGGNPIAAFPEAERLRRALRSLDVLVVADVLHNEIVDVATHLWPCAGQLERADVMGIMEFYKQEVTGQFAAATVPPVAERRPLWWPFAQLASRLGFSCLPTGLEANECSDSEVVESFVGGRLPSLLAAPHGVIGPRPGAWVTERLLPGGRWRVAPAPLRDALTQLREPPPLALVPGRQLRTMNSAFRDIAAPRERLATPDIHVAPSDAKRAGIEHGAPVIVRSEHGELTGTTFVDQRLRAGTVWIPHGWLTPNVCVLTSASQDIDRLTGMVLQSGVAVDLREPGPGA